MDEQDFIPWSGRFKMRCQKTIEKQGVYCSAAREPMTQSGCITCPLGCWGGGAQVGLLCNSCFLQSLNLNQFCLVKHTNQCPVLIILSCSGYCGSFMAAFMGLSSAVFTYITRVQETVKRVMWGRSYTRPVHTHAA